MPPTPYFFRLEDGTRLHVRHALPQDPGSLLGVLFYIHGMNGHANTAGQQAFFGGLRDAGFAVLVFDLPRHGYSEGEPRGYAGDFEALYEAGLRFASSVLTYDNACHECDLGIPGVMLHAIKKRPWFIFGESMGGLIALHIMNRARARGGPGAEKLAGLMLVAPALHIEALPPTWVSEALTCLTVPHFAELEMPKGINKSSQPDVALSIRDPEYARVSDLDDCARFPGVGLKYRGVMRWGQGSQFCRTFSAIDQELRAADYPLIVLHDPEDGVVSIKGSRRLLELSPSADKTLVEVPNGLHNLLHNERALAWRELSAWLTARCPDA